MGRGFTRFQSKAIFGLFAVLFGASLHAFSASFSEEIVLFPGKSKMLETVDGTVVVTCSQKPKPVEPTITCRFRVGKWGNASTGYRYTTSLRISGEGSGLAAALEATCNECKLARHTKGCYFDECFNTETGDLVEVSDSVLRRLPMHCNLKYDG